MPLEPIDEEDARAWLKCARQGDFARAWTISDRILHRHAANPDFTRPRHLQSVWKGEPVDGKRVLIRCYHGLGDAIQFIRYVPRLRTVSKEVVVWAPATLLPLLASIKEIDRLAALHDGAPDADYDVDVEVMELPFVFRSTLETIPRDVPYLRFSPASIPVSKPRIGLVWRCGDWEHDRSISFDALAPLLRLDAFSWCSLQQGRRPEETHPRLIDSSDDDLTRVAARVAALDLLITIDSMPAHLAGALGVPVWTLLRKHADWRWMEARDDSPWYPTMRLFRQGSEGDWTGVIARVRDALVDV